MDLKNLVEKLSTDECKELLSLLQIEINVPKFVNIPMSTHKDESVRCPHCSSQDIYGHGTYKGRRRYRCKSCKKSFNDFTGTAVSGIKKTEKFEEYLNLMVESLTIRKASACLGVNMKTVFDWRHKILSSLSALNGESFNGIVECDDKQVDISQKGSRKLTRKPYKRHSDRNTKKGVSNDKVSVMVATDRKGKPTMQVAKVGRIDVTSIEKSIGKYMGQQNVLCSDSHPSIVAWTSERQIEHHTFVASKQYVKDRCYHVQHVNSMDNQYERWMKRFCGVATKYLPNYLNWFIFLEKMKQSSQKAMDMAKIVLSNVGALMDYRAIERLYQNLFMQQYSKT
ncbi:hypothetical protein EZS27_030035 [termite gut metagenome]|uniref:ISXO2-like transposase domain-containing protein n=1 Tax=termite gut metagenome TaxID=433724 RepID=A0A5J4QF01_9ZZZZ